MNIPELRSQISDEQKKIGQWVHDLERHYGVLVEKIEVKRIDITPTAGPPSFWTKVHIHVCLKDFDE